LSQEQRSKLVQLIEGADFFHLPEELAASTSTADAFEYTVEVSGPRKKHRIVIRTDTMPIPLQQLINGLTEIAKQARTHLR
jgi:hypothetical protein